MADWRSNALTELLGIRLPIIQAPMAGASTPALAAAVTNAGGLGSLGCAFHAPDAVAGDCRAVREATNGAFNANFFVHQEPTPDAEKGEAMRAMLAPYYAELGLGDVPAAETPFPSFNDAMLDAVLAAAPPVVSFHFGLPGEDVIRALKDAGAVLLASATTVAEARAVAAAGFDAVVAQGFEAGGHRGTFAPPFEAGHVGTLALVPQVVDAVDIPVIAAGGIADGRGIAAALMLGAGAAQLGTAFVTCPESAATEVYRRALDTARDDETRLTAAFSGRPARGIENRYVREMAGRDDQFPPFPVGNALTGPLRKASAEAGSPDFVSLWAGQAAALAKALPAAELVDALAAETDAVLANFS